MNDGFEQLSTFHLTLAAACLALEFRLISTAPTKAVKPPGSNELLQRLGVFTFEVPIGFERRFWGREVRVEPRAYSSAMSTARRIADEAVARGYAAFATGTEGQWSSRRPSHRGGRR
jgi:hypothetical protein